MDLGQQAKTVPVGQSFHPVQKVPGIGLVQEIPLPRFLGGIGEGVKTDNTRSIGGQLFQGILIKLPDQGGI